METTKRAGRSLTNRHDGLSVAEAAETVGVHAQTIRNWIRSERLPMTRFGPGKGTIRIHPEDLSEVAGPH